MSKHGIRVLTGILVLLALLVASGAIFLSRVEKKLDRLAETPIPEPVLIDLPDGTYDGSHSVFPVRAEVRVTMTDGVIAGIDLLRHVNGQGEAGEAVIDRILAGQSLQVDAVSGATYSSQVIRLAVADALKQEP